MFLHLIFVLIIFPDTVRYDGGACKKISLSIDFIEVENTNKGRNLEMKKMNFLKFGRMFRTVRRAFKKCPYGRK